MINEFRKALLEAGIEPPRDILADGRIHRCDTVGKPGRRSGAYQLFPDLLGGGFQNWATGGWVKWRANRPRMSQDER